MLSLAVASFGPSAAWAQGEDQIAATVDGTNIMVSEVDGLIAMLTSQYPTAPKAELQRQVINRLVERRLIVAAAVKEGLNKDPVVLSRLEDMKQDLLQEVYLSRRAEVEITEEALKEAYEELKTSLDGKIEVHARHILVEDENAAKAIIAQLDGGSDFATLAKENSTGPTAERGGDLGFFPKNAMVTPFANAAFALEPGKYTALPVKTPFGWHVIKAEEQRPVPVPTFEESVDGLSSQLIGKMVDTLRASADVKVYEDRLKSEE
jgi:peptidyl-prolyl cis-trans isomerase C